MLLICLLKVGLFKLPFNEFTERRTGIDTWLRQMESIRDELQVSFLVISELSRGAGGAYGEGRREVGHDGCQVRINRRQIVKTTVMAFQSAKPIFKGGVGRFSSKHRASIALARMSARPTIRRITGNTK